MISSLVTHHLEKNLAKKFFDNVVRTKVRAKIGSVLYTEFEMAFGAEGHSGIYVGKGEVVELSGKGIIQQVPVSEFLDVPGNTSMSAYVSSSGGHAVGSQTVARRARSMVGRRRDYNLLFDNCHQFTSGCITGDFENSDNLLCMLKDTANKHLGADDWLVWDLRTIKEKEHNMIDSAKDPVVDMFATTVKSYMTKPDGLSVEDWAAQELGANDAAKADARDICAAIKKYAQTKSDYRTARAEGKSSAAFIAQTKAEVAQ